MSWLWRRKLAYQDQIHLGNSLPSGGASAYLRRTLFGTFALIVFLAIFGGSNGYDPTNTDLQSLNPQVPAQIQDWRGNSAHIDPAK